MPRRIRNVRLSVQELSEELTELRSKKQSWTHLRWQRFRLFPRTGDEVFGADRSEYNAVWSATTRNLPALKDGWALVSYVDGEVETVFTVSKVLRRGKKQHLILEEKSPQQFGPMGPNPDYVVS